MARRGLIPCPATGNRAGRGGFRRPARILPPCVAGSASWHFWPGSPALDTRGRRGPGSPSPSSGSSIRAVPIPRCRREPGGGRPDPARVGRAAPERRGRRDPGHPAAPAPRRRARRRGRPSRRLVPHRRRHSRSRLLARASGGHLRRCPRRRAAGARSWRGSASSWSLAMAIRLWPAGAGESPDPVVAADPGTVTILAGTPASIDPARHGDLGSASFVSQLYESLTAVDPSLVVRPALAESWTVDEDGTPGHVHAPRRPRVQRRHAAPRGRTSSTAGAACSRPNNPSPLASLVADIVGARDLLSGASTDPSTLGVRAEGDRTVVVDLERGGGRPADDRLQRAVRDRPPVGGRRRDRAGSRQAGRQRRLHARPRRRGRLGPQGEPELLGGQARHRDGPDADHAQRPEPGRRVRRRARSTSTPIGFVDAGWIAYDRGLGPSLRSDPSLSVTYYGFDVREPPFDDPLVRQAFAKAVDWRRLAALDEPGLLGRRDGHGPGRHARRARGRLHARVRPGGRARAAQRGGLRDRRRRSARSRSSPTAAGYDQRDRHDARAEPGRDHRLRDDGLRDLPGSAGLRPAADVEHLVGRGLPGPERLPGRPPGDRLDRQPGRLVVARVRRRHRRGDVRRRSGDGDRGLREGHGDRARPGAGGARSATARRSRSSATGCSGPARTASGSSGSPAWPGRTAGDARCGPRPWRSPLWLAVAGLALAPSAALAADEVSFGKPDAVADYGTSITFAVDVTRSVPLERVELRLQLPGHDRPVHRRRPGAAGHGHGLAAVRARRQRRRAHRPQHADHGDLGGVHGARRRAGPQPVGSHPLPGHEQGLADGLGRPDDRPLVRRR